MAGYFGGKKIKDMYYGGRKIKTAWYGGNLVYEAGPQPWVKGKSYNRGDVVTYNGKTYLCIESLSTIGAQYPPNATDMGMDLYWLQI